MNEVNLTDNPITEEKPVAQPEVEKKSEKPKKKMKKSKKITLIVLGVIAWVIAVQIYAADRYEAVVNVVEGENIVGINPLTERLDFGDMSPDNSTSRFIKIENSGNCFLCLKNGEKYIKVFKFGEIAELMTLSSSSAVIPAGEEYRIELNVYVPISAEVRKYTGKVWVFKLPKLF